MRFDLDPPVGVGQLRLGMTREEARQALAKLGDPREFRRDNSPPGWVVNRASAIFVYCDVTGLVNAIEFATPGFGTNASDQVRYRGIDVFSTPATDVVAALRGLGELIEDSEAGSSFTAPNRVLALWRDGGPV